MRGLTVNAQGQHLVVEEVALDLEWTTLHVVVESFENYRQTILEWNCRTIRDEYSKVHQRIPVGDQHLS